MASATDVRRRGQGGGLPRPRPGSSASPSRSGGHRALAVAGVLALLLVAYIVYRRRSSSGSAASNTSGTPGPDLTGSAAQQPQGGAASVPGNLPPLLVDQPDQVQQQVQQADTANTTSPTMIPYGGPGYGGGGPVQSFNSPTGQTFTQSAPGSDFFIPGSAGGPVDPGNITGHGFVGD